MKYFAISLAIAGFLLFTAPHVSAELYDDNWNQKYKFTDSEGNQYKV